MYELIEKIETIANNKEVPPATKIDQILIVGRQVVNADIGAIGQIIHRDTYRVTRQQGRHALYGNGKTHPLDQTFAWLVLEHNGLLAIPTVRRSVYRASGGFKRFRFGAYVGLPLLIQGQVFGVLEFGAKDGRDGDYPDFVHDIIYMMGGTLAQLVEMDMGYQRKLAIATQDNAAVDLNNSAANES